MHTEKNP